MNEKRGLVFGGGSKKEKVEDLKAKKRGGKARSGSCLVWQKNKIKEERVESRKRREESLVFSCLKRLESKFFFFSSEEGREPSQS